MNESSSSGWIIDGTDDRSRVLRGLLSALALTPILLFPEPARHVVSVEATLIAILSGGLAGSVLVLTLGGAQLQYRDEVTTSIIGIASVVLVAVLVWLYLPGNHIGTFLQFALAFMWGSELADAARYLVWPAISGSIQSRE